MTMMMLLGALTASLAGADGGHLHRTTIEHRGSPVTIDYRATTALSTRQTGMSPPTRTGGVVRCAWIARVAVERRLGGADGLSRVVDTGLQLKGSQPGTCSAAKKAIERQVAERSDEVRRHVLAVVERDRATLLAELEAAARPNAS
ncbi:hypothetical protein GG804_04965 [Sphingomonas histidinilytica]|uniref:hypothetical protein n=1 Tax=Rhizorhabdus histidinilytica TaxID=439228 RepID=UPI001ADAE34A|nr:hypothetical protein [Rhizorhabdus histidinilytica]MBO9376107.1 hypothetical protein [Rhizorhabdus histidinilytica]